jgi:hypothetical protein
MWDAFGLIDQPKRPWSPNRPCSTVENTHSSVRSEDDDAIAELNLLPPKTSKAIDSTDDKSPEAFNTQYSKHRRYSFDLVCLEDLHAASELQKLSVAPSETKEAENTETTSDGGVLLGTTPTGIDIESESGNDDQVYYSASEGCYWLGLSGSDDSISSDEDGVHLVNESDKYGRTPEESENSSGISIDPRSNGSSNGSSNATLANEIVSEDDDGYHSSSESSSLIEIPILREPTDKKFAPVEVDENADADYEVIEDSQAETALGLHEYKQEFLHDEGTAFQTLLDRVEPKVICETLKEGVLNDCLSPEAHQVVVLLCQLRSGKYVLPRLEIMVSLNTLN